MVIVNKIRCYNILLICCLSNLKETKSQNGSTVFLFQKITCYLNPGAGDEKHSSN